MQGGTDVSGPGGGSPARATAPSVDVATWTASFLRDALADGLIDRPTYDRLSHALAGRVTAPLSPSIEVPAMPTTAALSRVQHVAVRPTKPVTAAAPVPRADIAAPPRPPRPPVAAPTPPQPSAFAEWFARVRTAIVSDVAGGAISGIGVGSETLPMRERSR